MRKVTTQDIKKINEAFLKLKTYAAVARETGFSPSTVKKYIIPDFKSTSSLPTKQFNEDLPEFDINWIKNKEFSELFSLTNTEVEEIKELWNEISL